MYKEKFDELFKAINEQADAATRDEDFRNILKQVQNLPDYFNAVATSSLQIQMAIYTHHDAERGAVIEQIDQNRRSAHQRMTRSINKLNNICKLYHVEPMFKCDHYLNDESKDDRAIAAQFSWDYLKETVLENTQIIDKTVDTERKLSEDYDLGIKQCEDYHINIPKPQMNDVFPAFTKEEAELN